MFDHRNRVGELLYFRPIACSSSDGTQCIIQVCFTTGNILKQSRVGEGCARLSGCFVQNRQLVLHVDHVIRQVKRLSRNTTHNGITLLIGTQKSLLQDLSHTLDMKSFSKHRYIFLEQDAARQVAVQNLN
jgi:hypothetical protein